MNDKTVRITFEFRDDRPGGKTAGPLWLWLTYLIEAAIQYTEWRLTESNIMTIVDGNPKKETGWAMPEYSREP